MDSRGSVIASGEGLYVKPEKVDERMNSLSNPQALAQQLRDKKAEEKKADAVAKADARRKMEEQKAELKAIAKAAKEEEEFQREVEKYENAGEHPLMYLAALQSMSGENREMSMPLSGYGLSTDGVPAYDRAMGFSISDITKAFSNAQNIATQATKGFSISDITKAFSNAQNIATQATNIIRTIVPAPAPAVVQASQQIVAPCTTIKYQDDTGGASVTQVNMALEQLYRRRSELQSERSQNQSGKQPPRQEDFMTWAKKTRLGPVSAWQAMLGLGGLVGGLAVLKIVMAVMPSKRA
jgi:hypothetical protein